LPAREPGQLAIGDAGAASHCHPAALTASEHSTRTSLCTGYFCVLFCVVASVRRELT